MSDMKKNRSISMSIRFLAITTLLALAGGCTILDPDPDATIGRPDEVPESGETLYIEHCAGCHGLDGRPFDSTVNDLRGYTDTASYGQYDSALTNGPGVMPEYPQLDSMQRRMIFDHIKTFPAP
jgi:mono/diheme cytochrome c family protein